MNSLTIRLCIGLFVAGVYFPQSSVSWPRTFGGEGSDLGCSILQMEDGGLLLGGTTTSYGSGARDFYLIRTNGKGDTIWTRTYGGPGDEYCYSVIQLRDNGFALAGISESFSAGLFDFWLVKTDDNGDSLWSKSYGSEYDEICSVVIQTEDGGFALAGQYGINSEFIFGSRLMQLDENGEMLWYLDINIGGFKIWKALSQCEDRGFILAGSAYINDVWKLMVLRTDEWGNILWNRTYDGGSYDGCKSPILILDSAFLLGGFTILNNNSDFWLVKVDFDGNLILSRTYDWVGNYDICETILQTSDGGFALAGWTYRVVDGMRKREDGLFLRTDINGEFPVMRCYGGEGSDYFMDMIQLRNGDILMLGSTTSIGNGSSDVYIENQPGMENKPPHRFVIDCVYPNPFNNRTRIVYSLNLRSNISISLFDLNGRLMSCKDYTYQQAGKHIYEINGAGLPSGKYILRLSGEGTEVSSGVTILR